MFEQITLKGLIVDTLSAAMSATMVIGLIVMFGGI